MSKDKNKNNVAKNAETESAEEEKIGESAEEGEEIACEDAAGCAESEDQEPDLIALAQQKIDEYKDTLQRVSAEFDNYRKRTQDAVKNARADGADDVLEAFLPVLDAVEIAIGMIGDEATLKGVKLIEKQFRDLFSKYGVEEIEALGREFDPAYHNAVMQVEDADNAGKVVEVIRKGYKRAGRIIRYAMVKVAK